MFKITDVFMVILFIANILIILKIIGDVINKCCEPGDNDLKKNKKKTKALVIITVANICMMTLIVIAYFLIRFDSSINFVFNVNKVANEYYKEVDKDELLKNAFSEVLKDLNDPYAKILESDDIYSLKGQQTDFGYGIILKNNEAYVSNLNDEFFKQSAIKNDDRIVSVDGINVQR